MLPTSVFQGGKGNVKVFLRSYGGPRTNIKIYCWMWREGIARTLWSTWLSGIGFECAWGLHATCSPSLPALDKHENRTFLRERDVGESLQQRQHVAFNDRSSCRTHLLPDIQLPTRCLCRAHQAAEIHHHEGCKEGDTNSRGVLVCHKPYRVVWRYKSLLEELRENGVHVVGQQIENTGVFENVTWQQCVGQDTVAAKWNATDKIWDFSTTDVEIWMKQSVVPKYSLGWCLWGGLQDIKCAWFSLEGVIFEFVKFELSQ